MSICWYNSNCLQTFLAIIWNLYSLYFDYFNLFYPHSSIYWPRPPSRICIIPILRCNFSKRANYCSLKRFKRFSSTFLFVKKLHFDKTWISVSDTWIFLCPCSMFQNCQKLCQTLKICLNTILRFLLINESINGITALFSANN